MLLLSELWKGSGGPKLGEEELSLLRSRKAE